ncbi:MULTISPECIES: peptidoglycan DD-metalloendopeptidase family protein [Methylobacterium]|nr:MULTISPECIES: peptidoglycan DD-metalloendopeptidase family protein [Methylobacterium]TXN82992.1 peptidoglycan DD-metalloendopeptidase family protein [Methylobacterium sp. WL8]
MRVRGTGRRMKTLSRFALIGVIGSGAAACSSDASRLDNPFTNPFASNMASEPAATGSLPDMPSAPPIRTGRIQSEALGAPMAISPRPGPVAARVPTQPMAQTTRVASTGNPGWNAQGGTTITVAPNDSLNQMSTRFGVPASAILSANGLTNASQVTPGRQLVIPVYSASGMNPAAAPMTARAVPAAPSERIKAAETKRQDDAKDAAKAEAKRKEAAKEAQKEAEAKKLADKRADEKARKEVAAKEADAKKHHVRPGQVAKADAKPDAKTDTKADVKAEAARKTEAEAKQAKADAAKDAAKKVAEAKATKAASEKAAADKVASDKAASEKVAAKPEPAKAVATAKVEPASTGSVAAAAADQTFRWPAKGRVISGYGSSGNEGINIAVPEGTSVKAAEDGTVAYAGSDVKGYGKLVLVRHANGYVSAYAHNGELDVKPGEKVKRGQTIAKSGASGNVTSPQLHFEIRKSGAPIDPMSQLASN